MIKLNDSLKESLWDICIVLKKLGLPFVIFGILFLIYSFINNAPVIPFSYFIIVFLFLALLETIFENTWLAKEIHRLNNRIDEIEKKQKAK